MVMEPFRDIGARNSNWGRWGRDDERGTINLMSAEAIQAAAGLIREGRTFPLGIPFTTDGPQDGKVRPNPVRLMSETGTSARYPGAFRFADDYVFMALQAGTQWDSLSHVFDDDFLYNGFPADSITTAGARHCSIDVIADGVAWRAALLDVPRWRGVPHLEGGEPIDAATLDEVCEAQGVQVRSGDIVLVRSGWIEKFFEDHDAVAFKAEEPGLTMDCADWLHDHDVMAVASDNFAVEVIPGPYDDEVFTLHMVLIRDMGMPLGEMLDLRALSADCAKDGRYDVFFCAPPLRFPGGIGSPINPLAIK